MTESPRKPSVGNLQARIDESDSEIRLLVGENVQSVLSASGTVPDGYWRALVPESRPASALFLGLGGGTGVQLLWQRYGPLPVVGVENNRSVIDLGKARFGLNNPNLQVIEADASEYVRGSTERFGLVVVDIYDGETAPAFVSRRRFIRSVRQLVAPGGTLVWNLHRDRRGAVLRRRAGAGLLLDRRVLAGLNLIVHYHRPARRRRPS